MIVPKRSLRLLWTCATAIAVGWAIGGTGLVDAIEQRIDWGTAWMSPHDRAAERIVLVPITAEDYEDPSLFGSKRPLDPVVLQRLIETVGAHRPAVIGVDLDTSPEVFARLRTLDPELPLVWARAAWSRPAPWGDTGNGESRSDSPVELLPVLGYRKVEIEANLGIPAGVALVLHDADGIVRSYIRRFDTDFDDQPSFACAIIDRCARNASCAADLPGEARACGRASAGRAWQIDYREASRRAWRKADIRAGRVLDGAVAGEVFRDRIVLIGATYVESGDVDHPTPIGKVAGIEVVAQVLATELRGGGHNPGGAIATGILVAFETYLILAVLSASSLRRRVAGALVVVGGIAALLSLVNEYDLSRTGHFVLVLLAMLALQVGVRYVERSQEIFVDWWRNLQTRSSPSS